MRRLHTDAAGGARALDVHDDIVRGLVFSLQKDCTNGIHVWSALQATLWQIKSKLGRFRRPANVMCAGVFWSFKAHTVGSLMIPRASIKWVQLWELRAHILVMHSYNNAYTKRATLAGLVIVI